MTAINAPERVLARQECVKVYAEGNERYRKHAALDSFGTGKNADTDKQERARKIAS